MRKPIRDIVPDLNPLYEAIRDLVAFAQGEDGFIDVQDEDSDYIYTLVYDYDAYEAREFRVHGVRVHDGELQIIYDGDNSPRSNRIIYEKDDFTAADAQWEPVKDSEEVYYIHTLFQLADFIEEYISDDVLDKYRNGNEND